ncbi:unnamed protein product [Adineta ricciae]|uniref:Uncharacterized protein n=1 Tax=Adineta ricciae TaxID=249248 RepID=A0A815PUP2_ADIRI|nr:unnamed protein product [Adineta ricciae]CAF1453832.1 unnamed protein product [Adineta ricciae]
MKFGKNLDCSCEQISIPYEQQAQRTIEDQLEELDSKQLITNKLLETLSFDIQVNGLRQHIQPKNLFIIRELITIKSIAINMELFLCN